MPGFFMGHSVQVQYKRYMQTFAED